MRGRSLEVHDCEEELVVVFIDPRAASDDLLEFGHRPDLAIKNDELAGLRIDASRHQARRRDDNWERGLRVDEIVELRLTFFIVSGDAHHVALVRSG